MEWAAYKRHSDILFIAHPLQSKGKHDPQSRLLLTIYIIIDIRDMDTHSPKTDETLYVCEVVFLRATDVPVADLHNLSCDPYILATLAVDSPSRKTPQAITYRTHTCRHTLNPVFNAPWVVSGIPASGFLLSLRLRDEDPKNYDDKLGKAVTHIPWPDEADPKLHEGWESGEREYKVHKRSGSMLSKVFTFTAQMLTCGSIGHRVRVWVSVRVLRPVEDQGDRRLYTVGPRRYVRHFSPLIGRLLGSVNSPDDSPHPNLNPKIKVKPKAFIANRLQLAGPVPASLHHRYVGFAPFIKAMFRRKGFRGIVLNHTLHRQHGVIYRWDARTVWGTVGDEGAVVEEGSEKRPIEREGEKEDGKTENASHDTDAVAFAKQFLRMTSCGTNGRIFTYVIMLDGEWRFTETGEQLSIEFLSKHMMHSDVTVEIAYSGEFFVRPLRRRHRQSKSEHGESSAPGPIVKGTSFSTDTDNDNDILVDSADHPETPSDDPSQYELVIDNDSGTYRPREDLLPTLHAYLASPRNLGALGRVTCIGAFDERLKRWKEERKRVKREIEGKVKLKGGKEALKRVGSSFSALSSDSGNSGEDGEGRNGDAGINASLDMQNVVQEDAKRARENGDEDVEAKEEEEKTKADGPL